MYGPLKVPFHFELPTGSVDLKKMKTTFIYKREAPKKNIEKRIVSKKTEFLFHPVEPVNLPKFITPNLMLELKKTMVLPPKKHQTVYLRFPIEMGIISRIGKQDKVIDIFSRNPPKYTLYGDVESGLICRYYLTEAMVKPMKTDISYEGIVEVDIKNITNSWREISKLVFQGSLMKLYFSENIVSMKALARILDDDKAETKFLDKPIRKGQTKAYETVTSKNLKVIPQRFVMEGGY